MQSGGTLWRIEGENRAKKMRQDDGAEFISASVKEMSYMAQTGISIRMDAELKKNFENFCAAVGMNMSTAINMFAIACVREQRVPFEISAQRALPGEALELFTDTAWSDGEK